MARWLTYLKERSPVALILPIGIGVYLSAQFATARSFALGPFLGAMIGITGWMILARLMDEKKDYKKDLAAHPERPLPRGLLTIPEVEVAIVRGTWALLALGAAFAAGGNVPAGVGYAASVVYLWLMYKEFYVGEWLGEYPIPYAISHQVVVWPLYAYVFALLDPALLVSRTTLAYGLCTMGSSMSLEITRKLDPAAHPALKTYLVMYGPAKTFALTLVFVALSAYGAHLLGLGPILWPVQALVAVGASTVFWKPSAFKAVEGISALASLVHLFGIALAHAFGLPR
jgi:4-hydroxybenzoate polyprenyltransferase